MDKPLNLQDIYQQTLDKTKQGIRPKLSFSANEIQQITDQMELLRKGQDFKGLGPLLFICGQTNRGHKELGVRVLEILEDRTCPEEVFIQALMASIQQIISTCQREGEKYPARFIKVIKDNVDKKNPEKLEWLLRVLNEMGEPTQDLLKEKILQAKPSLFCLNKHKRRSRSIIEMFEQRWNYGPQT